MIQSVGYKSLGRTWIEDFAVESKEKTDFVVSFSESISSEFLTQCSTVIVIADNQLLSSVSTEIRSLQAAAEVSAMLHSRSRKILANISCAMDKGLAVVSFPNKIDGDVTVLLPKKLLALFARSAKFHVLDSCYIAEHFGSSEVGDILMINDDRSIPHTPKGLTIKLLDAGNIIGGIGPALMNYSRVSGHFVEMMIILRKAALSVDCVYSFLRCLQWLGVTESTPLSIQEDEVAKRDNFLSSTELMYT
jgi:hypothetical protein